jgi:hypothetical protein
MRGLAFLESVCELGLQALQFNASQEMHAQALLGLPTYKKHTKRITEKKISRSNLTQHQF